MTDDERKEFRRDLGKAVMKLQEGYLGAAYEETPTVVSFLYEIVAALLSLAAYLAKHNTRMGSHDFAAVCKVAREEQWPDSKRS